MDNSEHMVRKSWLKQPIFLYLVAIIVLGVCLTWLDIWHTDRCRREDLLYRARLVAQAIRIERIEALSGTVADKTLPTYRRLKEQLATIRSITPGCRFVYLLGQRPDGSVFFFVDNEPAGSRDESPPGQTYEEISDTDLQAFKRKIPLTSGPSKDRWGTWVSAMAPLIDPDDNRVVAVLGMDFPVIDWETMLLRGALPSILLTFGMALSLVCGSFLLRRLSLSSDRPPHKRRYRETLLAIVILGVFLSVSMTLVVNNKMGLDRKRAFLQLAQIKTEGITDMLHTLQYRELEGLAHLFEASEQVSPAEFSRYSACLLKNPIIRYWAWAERTLSPAKGTVQAQGLPMPMTWQHGKHEQRIPAADRKAYFPIVHIAPLPGNKERLGYDLGADKHRRPAVEEAMQSGLTTCLVSIPADKRRKSPASIEIFRPAFRQCETNRPMGVGMAVLMPDDLLDRAHPSEGVQLAFSTVTAKTAVQTLAASCENDTCPNAFLSFDYPIFAFGGTFLVSASAGMAYISLFPPQVPWVTLLIGLTLTTLLVVLINLTYRKREHLEALVAKRGRDLVATQDRMELAIKGADLGTWEWHVPTDRMTVNKNFATMLGYGLSEIKPLLNDWRQLLVPEDRPPAMQALYRHVQGLSDYFEAEGRFTHKTGNIVWVLSKGRVVEKDADGHVVLVCGTILNITNQKKSQEEKQKLQELLLQSQKMEAIGQLAGGVAHDLNNLLSPIIGYGDLLLEDLKGNDEQCEAVDAILEAGHRARDLVRQLLAFSRRQTLVIKPIDINQTIAKFQTLLRRTTPEDISLEIVLAPNARLVMADVSQVEQVVMNLAVNAVDAMPRGGKLTIRTAMTELDEAYASSHPGVIPGAYLMLAVSDTGCGMDEETAKQIFEPFFSTKGEQGTGLGLATVFGIVKQHNGSIWVYSEPGQGTIFKIYLPVCDAETNGHKTNFQANQELTGQETILLVEDDQKVRDLIRLILTRQGYTVLSAANGQEALALTASLERPVHLLLTDVIMPEMNGNDLYRQAVMRYPDLRVLFMSGYTDSEIVNRGVLEANIAFIEKPFTIKAIATKVREVLDSTSGDKVF